MMIVIMKVIDIILLSSIIHPIFTNRIKIIIHFVEYIMPYELE